MSDYRSWRGAVTALLVLVAGAGTLGAQAQSSARVTIRPDTVVRLKLDDRLNSKDAQVGDRFAAALSDKDRSGFPLGTRFEGAVKEVKRQTEEEPGILDMEVRRAYLPDGSKVSLRGRLASLARDDVKQLPDGRLEARKKGGGKVDWKWAGYGAAGGAVLSTVLGGKLFKGLLLGGLGGAVYGYLTRGKDKAQYRDVDLPRGTEFGMRLDEQVAFGDRPSYRYAGREESPGSRRDDERVAGEREEARYGDVTVRVNSKMLDLPERPLNLNGTLYVPLAPIAKAAGMRLTQRAGSDGFTLETPDGRAEGYAGETGITLENGQRVILMQPPIYLNETVFVSPEYLGRVAGMRADWDAVKMRLDLETQR